jgi:hypothetical protein
VLYYARDAWFSRFFENDSELRTRRLIRGRNNELAPQDVKRLI